MSRLKFSSLEVDKNVSQLTSNVKGRANITKVVEGAVNPAQLKNGEFVFTTVRRGQDGPQGPSEDQARIYFKDNSGNTFMFTGIKIG